MKFSIKDSFIKCDQKRRFQRIWSHLPKKSLMENFIFCVVLAFEVGMSNLLWKVVVTMMKPCFEKRAVKFKT